MSLLDKVGYLETIHSSILEEDETTKYQSMIGAYQWLITRLGKSDIAAVVASLSRFRAPPCSGHMEGHRHLGGHIRKFSHKCIYGMPDCSELEDQVYDWHYPVYGELHEKFPMSFHLTSLC